MQTVQQIFVGLDVSKDELVSAHPNKNTGSGWSKAKIINEVAKIKKWLMEVGVANKHFVLEHTGNYSQRLIHCLDELGASFSVVNPAQSRAMSKVLMKTSKTDDQDAQTLSRLGQNLLTKPYQMPPKAKRMRKEAFNALCALQKQERQLQNQLHAVEFLVDPNPAVLEAFNSVLTVVKTQIQHLQAQLRPEVDQIQEKQLVERISSIKGVGKATAEAVVALFGDLSAFDSAKAFTKFIGLAPSEFTSGKSVRGRSFITKKGNAKIRALLFNCARSAMNYNPFCKALYQRIIAKGKNGSIAFTAVMHKLARQIFGVVKSGIDFDPKFTIQKNCV
jgi:transposase